MARAANRICGLGEEARRQIPASPDALASFFFVAQSLTTNRADSPDDVRVDSEQQMHTKDGSITP